jgi:multidrug efflux pump
VFKRTAKGYEGQVARMLPKAGRWMLAFGVIVAVVGWTYVRLPSSFLPNEDQGYLIVNVQLPPGATVERTTAVMQQVEGFFSKQPEVDQVVA